MHPLTNASRRSERQDFAPSSPAAAKAPAPLWLSDLPGISFRGAFVIAGGWDSSPRPSGDEPYEPPPALPAPPNTHGKRARRSSRRVAVVFASATMKTRLARIFGRLAVRNRVKAVILGYRTGLVSPSNQPEGWRVRFRRSGSRLGGERASGR